MKHMVSLTVGLTLTLLALTSIATAQVPNQMQYQGYLTDDGGNPLDTTVDMEFVIYDDSIGSGTVWTETHLDVIVENGLFEVILGSVGGVTGDVVSDSVRWLGTTVGDDSEIYPRTKLITVPYAFRVGARLTVLLGEPFQVTWKSKEISLETNFRSKGMFWDTTTAERLISTKTI
jgi:hypothetical protein